MNPVKSFFNLFKKKEKEFTEADYRRLNGRRAREYGREHFFAKRNAEALECFDKAIECGMEKEVCGDRGMCLQDMGFHFDAIEDFDKAISFEQQDCNLFFMRGLSKTSVGDLEGARADLKEATRVSKLDLPINREYRLGAKEMGHDSVAGMYLIHLTNVELSLATARNYPEEGVIEKRMAEAKVKRRPSVKVFPSAMTVWELPKMSR